MKPELLAPANLRTLSAAVQAGADAVYLGGMSFGARKFAENFDIFQLEKAVDYCHLRGVKVYVTSNILATDNEIKKFLSFIKDAYNIGADAFIMQDIGMARLVKELIPDAKIHASTQTTVHNTEGACFMKTLGFERVVTARELSRKDFFDIAEKSGVETEIFVHGALCMSYSGQCLMSSMIGSRSGNRGACAQPCRLPYEIYLENELKGKGYYLSPRDLTLTGNMTDILKSGVTSLKIEGRMKGAEYVAAAVSVFRKLIDEERNAQPEEVKILENAFSRNGFTSGLFTGDIKRYINHSTGNDDIYKNRDESLLKDLKKYTDENANLKKMPAKFSIQVKNGEKLRLAVSAMGFDIEVFSGEVQKAQNKPTDVNTIEKQIAKTGEHPFFASEINVDTDGESFLSLSEINSSRREGLGKLEGKITSSFKRNIDVEYSPINEGKSKADFNLSVLVTNKEQLVAARKSGVKGIFAPSELASADETAVFPDIIHNEQLNKYMEILENTKSKTVFTANYAIIIRALELGKEVITAPALNVSNSESIKFWAGLGVREVTLSQELNIKQIEKISSKIPLCVVAYGKTVMMKTAVCPVKTVTKKCADGGCGAYLKDRKNEQFPVVCNGMTSFILNSKPIYMADKLRELERAGVATALLWFTDESPDRCESIIKAYINGESPEGSFTRGHFYRGAMLS
ncbi:MAG: DUF3656 domain-containing protein [Monoglobales bacterium]